MDSEIAVPYSEVCKVSDRRVVSAVLSIERSGIRSPPGQIFSSKTSAPYTIANLAIMSTLTVHCQWEDETEDKETGKMADYSSPAEAKKMKSQTLHTIGYLKGLLFFFISQQLEALFGNFCSNFCSYCA